MDGISAARSFLLQHKHLLDGQLAVCFVFLFE